MTLSEESTNFKTPQLLNCQDVHYQDCDQRKVEGQKRPNDYKILIVNLASPFIWHHILHVQHSKHWNRRGEEQTKKPCQEYSIEYRVFIICSVLEWSSDASVTSNGDEH